MRNISGGFAALLATPLGEQPHLVVCVDWASGGIKYYGEIDANVGSITIDGRLLEVSNITSTKKMDNVGTISTCSVILSDDDGAIKAIIDVVAAERRPVSIYQTMVGSTEMALLFRGSMIGPIQWSEGERKFSFGVETLILDQELGFAPQFTNSVTGFTLNPDMVGVTWPLGFGSPLDVPAVHMNKPPRSPLNYPFNYGDPWFQVVDGSVFPQNQTIKISIEGAIFSGSFQQGHDATYLDTSLIPPAYVPGINVFVVGDSNLAKYFDLPFGPRADAFSPPGYPQLENGESPACVGWLSQFQSIVNNYVRFHLDGVDSYFRCIRQEGLKVTFNDVTTDAAGTHHLLGPGDVILEVAQNGRVGWDIQTSSFTTGLQNSAEISRIQWHYNGNTDVVLWTGNPDIYICNIIPSSIKSVYAYRDTPKGRRFSHVPSIYYKKLENYPIQVTNQYGDLVTLDVTAIQLPVALEFFVGQGWSDTIYISYTSSVGPNTADVINYLLTTYSNIAPDPTTFAAVAALVANYPCGFAYFDTQNVIQACEEIAYQSRCGLVIDQGIAYITYISIQPAAAGSIADSVSKERTIELSYTSTEKLITKTTIRWMDSYQGLFGNKKHFVLYQGNKTYGLYARDYTFSIYNIMAMVQKSATFWSKRLGQSWRTMKVKTFLPGLPYQIFDGVTLDGFTDSTLLNAPAGLMGILQSYSYQSPKDDEVNNIELEFELPLVGGAKSGDYGYWMSDAGDVMPVLPISRRRETPYDLQLSDRESRARQRLAYQNTAPAIVTDATAGADRDCTLDIYANGYGVPATKTGVAAYFATPANPLVVGDHTTSYSLGDPYFAVSMGGGGGGGAALMPVRIAGTTTTTLPNSVSVSAYTFAETDFLGGPDKTGGILGVCVEGNNSTAISTGSFFFVSNQDANDNWYFAFPMGDCS